MNIPYDINMDYMGMYRTGMKKRVMWKLHNETDPECLQECVGDCENVSGRNGDENGVSGTVSRVCADTIKGLVLCEKEGTRELRSYADITKGKYQEDDRAIDAHNF